MIEHKNILASVEEIDGEIAYCSPKTAGIGRAGKKPIVQLDYDDGEFSDPGEVFT
ncbi:MAG: hypothetical protein ABI541_13125 [Betaproteobacteria bacterium]